MATTSSTLFGLRGRGARRQRPFANFDAGLSQIIVGAPVAFPTKRWERDPVGFAREVLGIELWSAQVAIVESIRDNRNTTVRSGHKCGKSTALAVAALWFYCTFPRARVLMTAVKSSQVDEVMWKEVRRLVARAASPLRIGENADPLDPEIRDSIIPVDGQCNVLARSGLRGSDERQVWGMTARDGEGLAGISGPNILVLVDEASGIPDRFFETLGSSLAGSGGTARKVYISNPTKKKGEFYKSHTTNAALFKCIHVSSEDTPNARGEKQIPGLAGPDWIAERKLEYGEESAQYLVRVKGEFVDDKHSKVVCTLEQIAIAQEAWDLTPEAGDLQIGIDPAGDGELGDETAIVVRRGKKIVTVLTWRGINEDSVAEHAMAILADHRGRGGIVGIPRIALDAEGGIGTRVLNKLRERLASPDLPKTELVGVRAGQKLWGSPEFHLVRDGLWGQARQWVKAGGALPDDVKLAQDLNAPLLEPDDANRLRATPKDKLRKELGRSTDRGDAACLAIWGFASITTASDDDRAPRANTHGYAHNPYEAEPDVAPDRAFNPYGGMMS